MVKKTVSEVKSYIDGITSFEQAKDFYILLDRIIMFAIHMSESDIFYKSTNLDAFGCPEDTVLKCSPSGSFAISLNHGCAYRESTLLSTEYDYICFSPECGIRLEDSELTADDIPNIETSGDWFQMSTIYSTKDLLALGLYSYMKRANLEAFSIDISYFPEILLGTGEDLDEYI